MHTIKEYPLHYDHAIIRIPKNGEVLGVQNINGKPVLCVKVDESNLKEKRLFGFLLTDDEFDDKQIIRYIGNYQNIPDYLIAHLFEFKYKDPKNKTTLKKETKRYE